MNALLIPGLGDLSDKLGISPALFWGLFALAAVWTLTLKGFALWYSARNYQRYWFIAMLVINTFGILELVYLLGFRKDKDENRTASLFNTPEGPLPSEPA
ncbi:MAG TPA: DUF5652 family protein [Candidatus Paceibacterota bacterium]|jgi:methionyl-tRNA synthetase